MTPKEQLAILQAYNAGKKIERRYYDKVWWEVDKDHQFNFAAFEYRINSEEMVMYSFSYWLDGNKAWYSTGSNSKQKVEELWDYYRNRLMFKTTDIVETTYKVLP